MFLLKSYNHPIPGNYYYVQTSGIKHQFDSCPMVEEVAKSVSNFRIANKLPRASLSESLEDVDKFTCARLQNSEKYCFDCQVPFETQHANHHFIKKGCATCGTPVNQN